MSPLIIETRSVDETQALGRRLGAALAPGDAVALVGPLGAGKTTLVKGMAEGAGVSDSRRVTSPTFIIVNEYETPSKPDTELQVGAVAGNAPGTPPVDQMLRIFHVDAYRLRGSADLEALGFEEMCLQGAVVIEWADRVAGILPPDHLIVVLEAVGELQRRLTFTAAGLRSQQLLSALGRRVVPPTDEG